MPTKGGPRKFVFTQRRLENLPVPASGRVTYRDAKTPGLAIIVTDKGAQSAYLSRKVDGRHIKHRLGRWPEDFGTVVTLRKAAQEKLPDLPNLAGQRRESRSQPTLADLWTCWWNHARAHKRPKSQAEDKRQWAAYLEGWGRRRLSAITRGDVAALHQRIGHENGHYAANRVLSLLSAMWNEGRRAGLCEGESPARDIRRFKETKRDRWLDAAELRRLLEVLSEAEPDVRDFFLLALLTGARRGNVQSMRWQDVDLGLCLWTIPAAEAKAGEPIVIPLVKPAVQVLTARLEHANGSEWVFPGRGKSGHIVEPKRAWDRIRQQAGLPDVRMHDLRRTMGSWLANAGTSLQVIGKALGHRDLKSTEIYSRLSVDPVREGMEKAAGRMLAAAGNMETEDEADGE